MRERVSPDPAEWLAFAEADLNAAKLLLADATVPIRIACFHAQQAAEKAIKTVLVIEKTVFRRTHDLLVLAALMSDASRNTRRDRPLGPAVVGCRWVVTRAIFRTQLPTKAGKPLQSLCV